MGLRRAAEVWAVLHRAQRPLQEAQEALRTLILDQSVWDTLGKEGCEELDAGVQAALATLHQALQRVEAKVRSSGERSTGQGRESREVRTVQEVARRLLQGVEAAQEIWGEAFSRPLDEHFRGGLS
ncbi:MAG: hypothetical protein IMX00_03330 [Limnochordales bacterium]|nr:hypothetical protein [Limnochordales bacterium]